MPSYWENFTDIADINAFRTTAVHAADHYRLDVYECGDPNKPVCLIIPPPCSPFVVLTRLALQVSKHYRVIGWETRGSPYIDQDDRPYSFRFKDYVADIGAIIKSKDIKEANIIAWCEGFIMSPHLANLPGLKIHSVANISPSTTYKRHETAMTKANEGFVNIMTSDDLQAARAAFDNFVAMRALAIRNMTDKEKLIARMLSLAVQSFEPARKFAMIAKHFHESGNMKMNLKFANQFMSLFIHSQDDRVISYKSTLALLSKLQHGKLVLNRTGGHAYLFHQAGELAQDIVNFFQDQEKLRS